jgi:hypothetical protein
MQFVAIKPLFSKHNGSPVENNNSLIFSLLLQLLKSQVMKWLSFLIIPIFLFSCDYKQNNRKFQSSFESVNDFSGFYFSPQGYLGTTYHNIEDSIVHSGTYAHVANITGANPPSTFTQNNNHRGYPTVQLQKTSQGVFKTPCYVTLWVYLDMNLHANSPENEWFSFATFTSDETDAWARTVLINLRYEDSTIILMHVPYQGQQTHTYQNTSLKFPHKQWVEIKAYLDFDPNYGYAKVWQDGVLVSQANVRDCNGNLAQAHFGMYSSSYCTSGFVVNDDLLIEEVEHE